ncbi:ABC transporter substrate-binding protein [Haematospirillum sp. H1815]|uniref:ABC transporter substrate-binding protein n=1 Tax=Haematospirillum sp. H1815 TaxID=2723108 RepID=UPI0014391164|nr:ABC transporter substrate-binding protein [Haematospirillum sp. H1815]NKD77336.1 ABC transporter substrate-binding protein [Haematospirillum sp. H1815]
MTFSRPNNSSMLVLAVSVLLFCFPLRVFAHKPHVASATLCADQVILKLADPDQIVAVSPDAADPHVSWMARKGAGYPRPTPSAEAYIQLGADVVITDAWSHHRMASLLERSGVRVVRLPMTETVEGIDHQIDLAAEALGQHERGTMLKQAMKRSLDAAAYQRNGADRRALYQTPGGYSAGPGTIIDTIMALNGLRNVTQAEGWPRHDPELLLLDPPDLLLASFFDAPYYSRGMDISSRQLQHLSGEKKIPAITVPGAMWACSTWTVMEAAEHLSSALLTLPPRTVEDGQCE